jgi:hypothetical protein
MQRICTQAHRRCGNFTRPRKLRRKLYHIADILTRKATGYRLQEGLFSVHPRGGVETLQKGVRQATGGHGRGERCLHLLFLMPET